ncbi:pyridoxamine 5'-phosphate oxidase family protein [Marivirga harenae]|uniref:pyridoxamine 5'-phosphate oxidase family protein n=1 Tax=Marivirga harenae TaxID=2010992 RepID=UPI0026DEDF32|nr:pyridoxamine 5'-phosphate oxidase family protein [Marivirga harenae]WKV11536.1 pyridoxamine 5'-phosphate oxidase family protein [Marivirga harenae]|tara:strand:- start:20021 stop:20590 length:570 start_codon:yes stop_codon:yes gene_type:complete
MSLIKPGINLEEIKTVLVQVLNRAGNDKHSAFRFLTLNTVTDGFPNSRYVVLRKFKTGSKELYIYTDYRSKKISEITENNLVSVLAYDKQRRFQIKLRAKAYIHHQDEIADGHWNSMNGGKESYNTEFRPGLKMNSLQNALQMKADIDDKYFAVIRLEVAQAEILQLNSEGHIRAQFDFEADKASFLVP